MDRRAEVACAVCSFLDERLGKGVVMAKNQTEFLSRQPHRRQE